MASASPSQSLLPQVLSLLRSKQIDKAAQLVEPLFKTNPADAQLRFAMALIGRERGQLKSALDTLESLHAQLPANPMIAAECAATQVMAGQMAKAIPTLTTMAKNQPNAPFPHYWLGQAYLRSFDGHKAIGCFEHMQKLVPGDRNILQLLGASYLSIGQARRAEKACTELLAHEPDRIDARTTLAAAYEQQSRLEDAADQYDAILKLDAHNPHALAGLSRVLQSEGKKDQAREQLRPALDADEPYPVAVSTFAALCQSDEDRLKAIEAARRALAVERFSAQDKAGLWFALARVLDATGEPDEAFLAYRKGNDLYPNLYNQSEKHAHTNAIMQAFSAKNLPILPRATQNKHEKHTPIFILGMPRSGTTLVEQILSSHPQVYAAGELQELRIIWRDLVKSRAQGRIENLHALSQHDLDKARTRYLDYIESLDPTGIYVTDKMPHNFEQLGLIELLFPDARVIHCTRDPLDTCLSTYFTQLSLAHAYATDLTSLGHAYNEYRRLMAHWLQTLSVPMLSISYEALVADLETHARQIVAFAQLDWDEQCLRFYETKRAIKTASVDQVRKPIYTSSVQRWKRYQQHLGPLIEALEKTSG